jgi:hypothetical protein
MAKMEVLTSWLFVQSEGVFTRDSGMPDIGCDGHLNSVGGCQYPNCKYKIQSMNGEDQISEPGRMSVTQGGRLFVVCRRERFTLLY